MGKTEFLCPHGNMVMHGDIESINCSLTGRMCTCVEWDPAFTKILMKLSCSNCPGFMLHDVDGMGKTPPE